ncbi:MAG: response regulator transcription factor [Armatimonadota bacterium]
MPYSILIVDPDAASRLVIKKLIQQRNFHPVCAECGQEALDFSGRHDPALMVLELMLPDMDGFDVCRRLRQDSSLPVMILSSRDSDIDRIVSLELGADDFIAKPFRPTELMARLEMLLRMTYGTGATGQQPPALHFTKLTIRPQDYDVSVRGETVHLTPKEFELLLTLAKRPGEVVSSEWLLLNIWGYDDSIKTRTLDVHINRLRNKIEPAGDEPFYIRTVPGVGYKFAADAA